MSKTTFQIGVDPTNPGQFFACCAMAELADRLTGRAEGWFEEGSFYVRAETNLEDLLGALKSAPLELCDPDKPNDKAPAMRLGDPFNLQVDWWLLSKTEPGVSGLKVWAGTMHAFRIANAMKCAISPLEVCPETFLDAAQVVYDPNAPTKKVEPFYFDARRGPNAHSRDVGFSPNDLKLKTAAFPAVEFLCLLGLQRIRPIRLKPARHYRYFTWLTPTAPALFPAAAAGLIDPSNLINSKAGFELDRKNTKHS